METTVYNQSGKETGKVKLPEKIFSLPWNADLVHQVVVAMRSNKRTPIAHTKDRSEVSGTGKKPWRQKGTGRARHGSRRSPIWRTGGVAHGPRNDRNYTKKINRKMAAKALFTVLSRKFGDNEIIFIDDLKMETPKTSTARNILNSLSKVKGYERILSKKNNSLLLATDDKDVNVEKSFNNFGNVQVGESRNLNPLDILNYKFLLIENPEKFIGFVESKLKTSKNPKASKDARVKEKVVKSTKPKKVTKKVNKK